MRKVAKSRRKKLKDISKIENSNYYLAISPDNKTLTLVTIAKILTFEELNFETDLELYAAVLVIT